MTRSSTIDLRSGAFCHAHYWCGQQLQVFFPQAMSPLRAAEVWAARQEGKGWLCSAVVDACLPPPPATWFARLGPGSNGVDFDRVEHRLGQRWLIPPRPTRVYWPSQAFAQRFGSWAGTDSLSCPHKVGHDLMCTWVWLRYFARCPTIALDHWQSEGQLIQQARARGGRESIPDALVMLPRYAVAIEVCGQYGAALLRKRWERIRRQMTARYERWSWELW